LKTAFAIVAVIQLAMLILPALWCATAGERRISHMTSRVIVIDAASSLRSGG
jgi:hypothetical protein